MRILDLVLSVPFSTKCSERSCKQCCEPSIRLPFVTVYLEISFFSTWKLCSGPRIPDMHFASVCQV